MRAEFYTGKVVVKISDMDLEEYRRRDGREYSAEESRDGGVWFVRLISRNGGLCRELERSKRLIP